MSKDSAQWCVLKRRLEVGGEQFEAGQRFRVAWRHKRGEQESLTLDGNGETEDWTSARVIHNVPIGEVLFVRMDTNDEPTRPRLNAAAHHEAEKTLKKR